ncbi:MAG TPA: LysM peptidoglycan-binding domain-containing protein [Polyangiaceae bacterium]
MKRGGFPLGVLAALVAVPVFAQAPGPSEAENPGAPAPGSPAQSNPAAPVVVPGPVGGVIIGPNLPDPNASLPSSSQPKVGDQSDSFDLGRSGGGSGVVTGGKGGTAILEGGDSRRPYIPSIHLVRRGDTLWDLCDTYYGNPWQWPRIWSYNPQIANPHWIYPGDQVRMQPGDGSASIYDKLGSGGGSGGGKGGSGLVDRRRGLATGTIVLRDQGFLGDPESDVWGEVAGAMEEQMLLAEGNRVYLLLKADKTVKPGEELTVFRGIRSPDKVPGARKPPGEIVAVQGTVRIESVDPKTHMAKASIVESIDVIERGAKIGPVRRRFTVVPPLKNAKTVVARVLTSVYPLVYVSANQVVFLDHGSEDGLRPGNRLVVLRRGDTWRTSLSGKVSGDRVRTDVTEGVRVERTPLPGEPETFPDEVVAELRVLSTERYSSLALVTQSERELVVGDAAVAKAGF